MREKVYQPFVSKYIIAGLAALGAAGIVIGCFMIFDTALFLKNSVKTTGVITGVSVRYFGDDEICDAKVSYTVDGNDYEYLFKKYDMSKRIKRDDYIGMKADILYNAKDPSDARRAEKPFALPMLITVAGAAAAGGCGNLVRRNRYYKTLINDGILLDATVTGIKTKSTVVKHRSRYSSSYDTVTTENVIVCEWTNPLTGESYTFSSCKVNEYVDPYVGHEIKVYVDPNDFSKYFVDADSLLEKPLPIKRDAPPPEIKRAPWEEP